MKKSSEIKSEALALLKGNWKKAVVCTFVVFLICLLLYIPYFVAVDPAMAETDPVGYLNSFKWAYLTLLLGGLFIASPLMIGLFGSYRMFYRDRNDDLMRNTFSLGFSGYGRNVSCFFLMNLFIGLWSMLFFIPGIIKSFSYAMTPFILKDYPELSANQAINLSRRMMKGHKMDLFILYLSFFGWMVLACFTFGIGYLWLAPYMLLSTASFYEDVRSEYESSKENHM